MWLMVTAGPWFEQEVACMSVGWAADGWAAPRGLLVWGWCSAGCSCSSRVAGPWMGSRFVRRVVCVIVRMGPRPRGGCVGGDRCAGPACGC